MPADFVNPGRYWTPAPAEAPQESDAPALTEHNTGLGHNLLPLAHCRPKRACPAPARFTGEGPQLAEPSKKPRSKGPNRAAPANAPATSE